MNPHNKRLIEEAFRKVRLSGKLADSSIIKYRNSANKFFAVIGNDISIDILTTRHFENFILKMKDNNASNSRIANVISALKRIIHELRSNNLTKNHIDLESIIKPKITKKSVNYLTEEEVKKLVGAIENDIENGIEIRKVRMMSLVTLLLQTGARIGEALSINKDDIDWNSNEVAIIGKGDKPRDLFLRKESGYWIKKYLSMRNDDHQALFVALSGKSRWQQTDVGRSFRRYRYLSGIKQKFTLHTLRHTCATQLLLKSFPINAIQEILGHSDLETTTKYYLGAAKKDRLKKLVLKDEYFDFIPKSKIVN